MTNEQLYLAIGVPTLVNVGLISFVVAYINAKFAAVDQRFKSVDVQLAAMNHRLDHMQEMWRSELRRVEEVLDARLKHLEER